MQVSLEPVSFFVYLKPLSNMIQKLTVERMAVVMTESNVFLMRIRNSKE